MLDDRARNLVWRHFVGPAPTRVEREPEETDAFERELVADLRRAAERYPDDRAVAELIAALREANRHFADLWTTYDAGPGVASRKTLLHPALGPVTLDCDVLTIDGSDLRIVLYSAAPGMPGAETLERLRSGVVGRPSREPTSRPQAATGRADRGAGDSSRLAPQAMRTSGILAARHIPQARQPPIEATVQATPSPLVTVTARVVDSVTAQAPTPAQTRWIPPQMPESRAKSRRTAV